MSKSRFSTPEERLEKLLTDLKATLEEIATLPNLRVLEYHQEDLYDLVPQGCHHFTFRARRGVTHTAHYEQGSWRVYPECTAHHTLEELQAHYEPLLDTVVPLYPRTGGAEQ